MSDDDLASKQCIPCRGGVPPLAGAEASNLLKKVHAAWELVDGHHLARAFVFPDFKSALVFTNRVGEVAETNGHHPDIFLTWGKVNIEIYTHKINGLTESDFVLAAKLDAL